MLSHADIQQSVAAANEEMETNVSRKTQLPLAQLSLLVFTIN